MDIIDKIIAYESGEMTATEIIDFFQESIDDGSVWALQGSYGRMANYLIEQDYCTKKEKENEWT